MLQDSVAVEPLTVLLGLRLQDQRKEFLMLFMAIASHKLISGLALSSRFLKDGATTRQVRRRDVLHEKQCSTQEQLLSDDQLWLGWEEGLAAFVDHDGDASVLHKELTQCTCMC
jgi:hypothetical protein